MAIIRQSFLVELQIDTVEARNFPFGLKDQNVLRDNGCNWNSYPNWDINYGGNETAFIESAWAEFRKYFKYDGLECVMNQIGNDE